MKYILLKYSHFYLGVLFILLSSFSQAAPLHNPTFQIVLGAEDHWEDLPPFGYDPQEISGTNNKLDWNNVIMADHAASDSVYLKYQMWKSIDTSNFWAYQVFIDTDESANTGYQFGAVGADFLLEGSTLWRYTGSGTDWNWTIEEVATSYSSNSQSMQFRLSRHILAQNDSIRLVFYGNNAAYGGDTPDIYPNGALDDDLMGEKYYTYKFYERYTTIYSNPVANDSINIDGDLDEWSSLNAFNDDPNDMSGENNKIDWRKSWMAHDDHHMYIAYELENDLAPHFYRHYWAYQIFIDTDESTNTGFRNGALGADFAILGRYLYRYTGSGTDWSWRRVTRVKTKLLRFTDNHLELFIPRSDLGYPDRIRLFFHGDNRAFGGDTYDVAPDGAFSTTGERYFTYQFNHARKTHVNNVTLDGDISDWTTLSPLGGWVYIPVNTFEADPEDMSGENNRIDWLRTWMASGRYSLDVNLHNLDKDLALFFAYQTKAPIDESNFWGYQTYLDIDKSNASGYKKGVIGADYLLEGKTLWRYTGSGVDWSWVPAEGHVFYAINGNIAEFAIVNSTLTASQSIRMILAGNNEVYGGDSIDHYPSDLDEDSYIPYFTFIVNNTY